MTHPLLSLLSAAPLLLGGLPAVTLAQEDAEIEALIAQERAEADLLRRRGRISTARRLLSNMLEEEPEDAEALRLLALCRFEESRYKLAVTAAQEAVRVAVESPDRLLQAACARTSARILGTLGRSEEALEVLLAAGGDPAAVQPGESARDALALGHAFLAEGDRDASIRALEAGLQVPREAPWEEHHAMGLCAWQLGRLELASRAFVLADRIAGRSGVSEPDVLVALAGVYFESEREVEAPDKRSAGSLFREALEIHPNHPGALLGLFELHRYNRRRHSRTPEDLLSQLLQAAPNSVEGLLAKISADLSDGRLKAARADLARVEQLAPGRREFVTFQAALAWIEHRRQACEELLTGLVQRDRGDSRPEREVGRHLLELYRFAEAVEFLQRAVGRDRADWEAWTLLGKALANTGQEDAAREALEEAERMAAGRQDAWRNNTRLVLSKMKARHVREQFGSLEYSWRPEVAEIFRTYMVPFYQEAREDLAERYGYTPGNTLIEVFRAHQDFSVRSVGFEGFPALGVCFGSVVTALSPLSEMRGNFSWVRTGFHEFSHVVHLGLSHNRCPRWITEGLATWEEVRRNPTWTRNMRRELLDSRANGDLIPVRELNRAFRGPRILFGYYQGGLLCTMLIEQHGFSPMIELLEAFDRGLDLDDAFAEVFDQAPEEVDLAFGNYVDGLLEGLHVEPRWTPRRVVRLRLQLSREVPLELPAIRAWQEDWITVGWGSWQRGKRIDAEEALRVAGTAGELQSCCLSPSGTTAGHAHGSVTGCHSDGPYALAVGWAVPTGQSVSSLA